MLKPLLQQASPAGAKGRLSILIFHRVLPEIDPLFPDEPDLRRFDEVCGWLKSWFNVLPLDDALRRLDEQRLPARAAAITFDDGYADNHDCALPILRRHGLTATFFIASSFLDGGRMWNDGIIEAIRRTGAERLDLSDIALDDGPLGSLAVGTTEEKRAAIAALLPRVKYLQPVPRNALVAELGKRAVVRLPDDLMMTSPQVAALRDAGMTIGAHTRTHPILARLDAAAARDEMIGGKRDLENLLQQPVPLFAYPNGRPGTDYQPETVALAREAGFEAALTTAWGAAQSSTDRFQIPRFTPWDRPRWRFGTRLLRNLWAPSPA